MDPIKRILKRIVKMKWFVLGTGVAFLTKLMSTLFPEDNRPTILMIGLLVFIISGLYTVINAAVETFYEMRQMKQDSKETKQTGGD